MCVGGEKKGSLLQADDTAAMLCHRGRTELLYHCPEEYVYLDDHLMSSIC